MKISLSTLIIFIVLATFRTYSQPYYYTSTYEPFPYGHHHTGDVYRINLSNPAEVESLITDIYDLGSPMSDEYGNWLAYEESFRLTIMNLNNQTQKNIISQYSEGIRKFSYAKAVNKLIVLFDGNYPNPEKMVLVDPMTLTITDSVSSGILWDCNRSEDIILSKSGDIMYLMKTDTILHKRYIASYSLSLKQIVSTKYIEELSYPGANEFYFDFRRNGFGVVESWIRLPISTSYYRIYFLDNDSLSITIQRDENQTWGNAYIANNGKYLLMFKSVVPDRVAISPLTGEIDIYDMTDGEIKKTIQLPPDGEVICFENYPNNVYYSTNIELPTRQVWDINLDSLFNELEIIKLNPSSTLFNSDSLTITITGNGFDSLSTFYFNGQARTTTFISENILNATLLPSDFSEAGSFLVYVGDRYSLSEKKLFRVKYPE